ncbi:MAG: undecaprenyl-diphosphatase UppP [Candidatus Woesearchaeota archaeon]
MLTILEALILGIIQGITEWLPVSSSGHLALFQNAFGMQVPVLYDIFLHVATVLVLLIFFRRRLLRVIKAIAKLDFNSEDGRLALFVVIGSIPTAIIGFLFKGLFKTFFYSILAVGIALIVTGFILLFSESRKEKKSLGWKDSVFIGIAQGIAIIPGISRSGATISTALLRGVRREEAAEFSFILAIPAIIGAAVFDFSPEAFAEINLAAIIAGMMAAFVVGYLSLSWLMKLIRRRMFHYFGWYCLILGAAMATAGLLI